MLMLAAFVVLAVGTVHGRAERKFGIVFTAGEKGETGSYNSDEKIKKLLMKKMNLKESSRHEVPFPEVESDHLVHFRAYSDPEARKKEDKNWRATKTNIKAYMNQLTDQCQDGDSYFIAFNGHGGRDTDSGELRRQHSEISDTLLWATDGTIKDNEWYEWIRKLAMKKTRIFFLVSACFAGTPADLPYKHDSVSNTIIDAQKLGKKGGEGVGRYYFKTFEDEAKGVAVCFGACPDDETSLFNSKFVIHHSAFEEFSDEKIGDLTDLVHKFTEDELKKTPHWDAYIPQMCLSHIDEEILNYTVWDFLDFEYEFNPEKYLKENRNRINSTRKKYCDWGTYTYLILKEKFAFVICFGVAYYFRNHLATAYEYFLGDTNPEACEDEAAADDNLPENLTEALTDPDFSEWKDKAALRLQTRECFPDSDEHELSWFWPAHAAWNGLSSLWESEEY